MDQRKGGWARKVLAWAMSSRPSQERDFPYFRRLFNSIVVALLAASFIPLLVIGGGMYYHTVSILEQKTLCCAGCGDQRAPGDDRSVSSRKGRWT